MLFVVTIYQMTIWQIETFNKNLFQSYLWIHLDRLTRADFGDALSMQKKKISIRNEFVKLVYLDDSKIEKALCMYTDEQG